jgi:hypothetical protein
MKLTKRKINHLKSRKNKTNKNISKSYKNKKRKTKRNYEEMYYQPMGVPLILFKSKSKSLRRI